jgi:hypothetical protein
LEEGESIDDAANPIPQLSLCPYATILRILKTALRAFPPYLSSAQTAKSELG